MKLYSQQKYCSVPIDLFTFVLHFGNNHLQRLHVFGWSVYVLGVKIQDGKKVHKWNSRSQHVIYLAVSKAHFSIFHLVLNLETGKITPQYHAIFDIFDDNFSAVCSDGQSGPNVWESLFNSNLDLHLDDTSNTIDDLTIVFHRSEEEKEEGGGGILPIMIPIMITIFETILKT